MGKRASYFAITKRAPGKKNMCLHASGAISFQINKICFWNIWFLCDHTENHLLLLGYDEWREELSNEIFGTVRNTLIVLLSPNSKGRDFLLGCVQTRVFWNEELNDVTIEVANKMQIKTEKRVQNYLFISDGQRRSLLTIFVPGVY